MAMYKKMDNSMEGLERRLDGAISHIRDEVRSQIWDQLQSFMVMFTRQNQVRISPNFSPRERTEPILIGHGVSNTNVDPSEIEADSVETQENVVERRQEGQAIPNQLGFLMPKLEIPMFDGINPWWWVRKYEWMFNWYNVPERHWWLWQ